MRDLFERFTPIIKKLNLVPEIVKYFAQLTIKSQVFQITRRDDNKYLLLIAFVIHQYFKLNDLLIDKLIQTNQTAINTAVREHRELFYENRRSRHQAIMDLSEIVNNHLSIMEKIVLVINANVFTDKEKIINIRKLLSKGKCIESTVLKEKIAWLGKESKKIVKDGDYYDILESHSLKMQNRASDIVKNIQFDSVTSNKKLLAAIEYYKQKATNLGSDAPLEFLEIEEQDAVFDDKGKFRISLYKILLFEKIAAGIKSGALNVQYSYKYRPFDDYMIPKETWKANKNELLKQAGLSEFGDFYKVEPVLKQTLKDQYQITNENINNGKNIFAKFDHNNNLKIVTPKKEKDDTGSVNELFPKNRFVSLFEVLSTINKLTKFTDSFEHWKIKHNRNKPKEKTFIAGAIGYGCNHGINKIAKISNNINPNELVNTVNWYFTPENLNDANDKILKLSNRLDLSNVYYGKGKLIHTSSDGTKNNIAVESLNASYSYKHFGKGKGVNIYSFIDNRHLLFYSTVITPSEREAPYVIDGLMHNDVIQSDIHSTDTHGYSEIIFRVSHLLGISFAPRIKNFKKQKIYSFQKKSDLKAMGFRILPNGRINIKIIREYWDEILRFIATIILKETTASQLFRRLSSYSRQHPLYRALKQFGRIIKSIFLLKYIDDLELRQAIEKQLNKIENAHRLESAVFFANNEEFQQSTKEEQLIAEGCKRLIENAIICWNYLYLTKLIYYQNEKSKLEMIHTIQNGSIVSWQHINLQGEYDFSEKSLKNSFDFNLTELLGFKV